MAKSPSEKVAIVQKYFEQLIFFLILLIFVKGFKEMQNHEALYFLSQISEGYMMQKVFDYVRAR